MKPPRRRPNGGNHKDNHRGGHRDSTNRPDGERAPPLFPYPILYRSPRFVVVEKPPGLPVHPGPRTTRTLEDALPALSRRPDGPWLAHRLDADTAGCVLIALRKQALLDAQECFRAHRVGKTYWAVVTGRPASESGTIDIPLARQDSPSGWRMIATPSPDAQPARTDWRTLGHANGLTWLELTLHTGRTHQARVHCAALGCPILGDPLYNPEKTTAPLHLLSRRLQLTPGTERIDATATPPPAMADTLARLGYRREESRNQSRKTSVSDGV
ncbi:ribosomal RNA large subunit 23S rRNA pseudouridine synthase A [Neoasaia chiangmaiensis NBRC 101099]|uniref:RluA family pseudouridine synthase n=1 Tax=Neoasaia chiangmaiensis TaxID=320497 RepID=UPI00098A581F|nr:RNA pseudouridine synthase [Neoasaia chiangmaiensis]GBR38909.1 ribosomal RNA large subunit 23S rRNA pseudouridine synthase A [Neoasaia chiangmaiensis NBRC 101099]GEN15646.1 RNA pseudouridine synthase [Neoasaia chiangmaiensis]